MERVCQVCGERKGEWVLYAHGSENAADRRVVCGHCIPKGSRRRSDFSWGAPAMEPTKEDER